ncbi:hypothetical protein CEXT_298531 [Caerostris extrusa]|uniref:Uncharacterized protein n=1 Tax=Caerostris extrusa TaxID=172846 RepID=A0AAV4QA54_CAEEX|nr:hypothetical protein CEXT_298531 [Caerostris extrusa]
MTHPPNLLSQNRPDMMRPSSKTSATGGHEHPRSNVSIPVIPGRTRPSTSFRPSVRSVDWFSPSLANCLAGEQQGKKYISAIEAASKFIWALH